MLKLVFNRKQTSLLAMLVCLTVLFIAAQLSLFLIHCKVSELVDSLVTSSIILQLLHPIILLPIIAFALIQVIAYGFFIGWIWFVTLSFGEFFKLSKSVTHWLGIMFWGVACVALLMLNQHYFPNSFFAKEMAHTALLSNHSHVILAAVLLLLAVVTLIAYINYFWFKRHRWIGSVLLVCGLSVGFVEFYDVVLPIAPSTQRGMDASAHSSPNIIFIGLDSLRPDFIRHSGNQATFTPHIDDFLHDAVTFTEAYTPLARTFPAWISILTAKYPKHHFARNNLSDPARVIGNDTLAKRLKQAGYETIYATDEKRFSNITEAYGFDRILGSGMGVDDFLLGGLTDFPMSNLLVNLSVGRFLFPYNYGNRAAAITYDPDTFLQQIKWGLANRSHKPLFLAIHLCLSHWPFTWARDGQNANFHLRDQYRSSVEGIDKQLGQLLQILKNNGLLENSLVVMLSDHGTALGLPGDRVISEKKYVGDAKSLKLIPVLKLSSAPEYSTDKRDYTISTAYGQGTNVLSLAQYHVILAFKRFGSSLPAREIHERSSLIDIAPTILASLSLAPLKQADGVSLRDYVFKPSVTAHLSRSLFMETGDSMTEIETDHIYIEKVIKHQIGIYWINPLNGLLLMNLPAEQSISKNKQRAILWNDWILAHYPARLQTRLASSKGKGGTNGLAKISYILPAYFVIANLKTGQWSVGLSSPLAKSAPLADLLRQLKDFYGDELPR